MADGRGLGQYYITGAQGCGKTTLAKNIVAELVKNLDCPLVGVDSHGDLSDMYGIQPVTSVHDVIDTYVTKKQSVLFDPPEDEPLERLARALLESGRCVLFIDEMSYSCKFDTMKKWTRKLFRKYRKCKVAIVGTTQVISDIHPLALQGTLELHAGLQVSERSIQRLENEFRMKREALMNAGRGHFETFRRPFSGE